MSQAEPYPFQEQLNERYPISPKQVAQYQQDGYIKLKNVFSADTLAYYGDIIRQEVAARSQNAAPLNKRTTYGKAFLQIMNLWTANEAIKTFCFAQRLGQIATELMQVDGVRMYHDQALFKEPSGGFTPWHADQYYWPFDSPNCITAWIPLQAIPLEMGPLSFCIGSQKILQNRHLGISDESEAKIETNLKKYPKDVSPYELGEISFHAGWNFHRAGPNNTDKMRAAMTVIMMEDGMRLIEPKHASHQSDWDTWLPGAKIGEKLQTHLNPLIYSQANHK
ncbi:MAG: phytanoyl-CoA dioxygenase family protein [Chloroflexota bacterium]